ncbi:MAG TPA: glycosyltransferase [Anaerolineae bacterium]|nr:glycosyltransferase [Anaerolineae bacterium]
MRLALIAPFAIHPKGTTRWRVLPLARALAVAGHTVRVVIPPYDWPRHSGLAWRDQGVEVVNVAAPAGGGAAGHLLLAGRLARAVLAWQPDVVHLFKPKGPGGLAALALLAAGGRGTPPWRWVVDADDYEAGWNEVLGYPALWARGFAWQERHLLRRAHAVTAASRWLAQFAAELGQPRVVYLPNGVEFSCSQDAIPARLTLARNEVDATRRVLLYTRFVEHTPEEVWRVWREVLAAAPGAQLLAAGQGRGGEERQLAHLAAQAGAASTVRLLGWLPADARPGLFAAVDAALLPVQDTPLNRAKSPMRLLDLLAAGVPVATQRVGEYGTYVVDGVSGLLAEPGDAAGLAERVVRLLHSPELAGRLGQGAAATLRAQHAWPGLARSALAAYQAAGVQVS